MSTSQRFLREVEDTIARVNRDVLSKRVGTVGKERLAELARAVAELRADYLHAALDATWTPEGVEAADLKTKRGLYEEAVAAFDALERAVERNYVAFE